MPDVLLQLPCRHGWRWRGRRALTQGVQPCLAQLCSARASGSGPQRRLPCCGTLAAGRSLWISTVSEWECARHLQLVFLNRRPDQCSRVELGGFIPWPLYLYIGNTAWGYLTMHRLQPKGASSPHCNRARWCQGVEYALPNAQKLSTALHATLKSSSSCPEWLDEWLDGQHTTYCYNFTGSAASASSQCMLYSATVQGPSLYLSKWAMHKNVCC